MSIHRHPLLIDRKQLSFGFHGGFLACFHPAAAEVIGQIVDLRVLHSFVVVNKVMKLQGNIFCILCNFFILRSNFFTEWLILKVSVYYLHGLSWKQDVKLNCFLMDFKFIKRGRQIPGKICFENYQLWLLWWIF